MDNTRTTSIKQTKPGSVFLFYLQLEFPPEALKIMLHSTKFPWSGDNRISELTTLLFPLLLSDATLHSKKVRHLWLSKSRRPLTPLGTQISQSYTWVPVTHAWSCFQLSHNQLSSGHVFCWRSQRSSVQETCWEWASHFSKELISSQNTRQMNCHSRT